MEDKTLKFSDVESCASKRSQADHKKHCMMGNYDMRQAKRECQENVSRKQTLKQQQCECLRIALGYTILYLIKF